MKVFIAYAKDDRRLASEIAVKLHARGFDSVFLDEQSLPAGQDFDSRIRAAIYDADIFVFLLTADSIQPGAYALTELNIAQSRWPNPVGHVLAVLPRPHIDLSAAPAYLTASVTVLRVIGNAATEAADNTLSMAEELRRQSRVRSRRKWTALGAIASLLTVAVAVSMWISGESQYGRSRVKPKTEERDAATSTDGLFAVRVRCRGARDALIAVDGRSTFEGQDTYRAGQAIISVREGRHRITCFVGCGGGSKDVVVSDDITVDVMVTFDTCCPVRFCGGIDIATVEDLAVIQKALVYLVDGERVRAMLLEIKDRDVIAWFQDVYHFETGRSLARDLSNLSAGHLLGLDLWLRDPE